MTARELELEYARDIAEIAKDCAERSRKGVRKPLHPEESAKLTEDLIRLRFFANQLRGLISEAPEVEERIIRGERAENLVRHFWLQAEKFVKEKGTWK